MPKALQCPDCGNRHPLKDVAGQRTFRCRECRRLLKVPASVAEEAQAEANGTPARSDADGTAVQRRVERTSALLVPPSQRGDAIREQTQAAARTRSPRIGGRPPRSVRIVVWLMAIPLGLVPVVVVGRLAGVLTASMAADVFIGAGLSRFLPALMVLLAWAALTATFSHLTLERLAHRRAATPRGRPGTRGARRG